jgi:chloramphenicol 3-O phosphotransferase
MLNGGSSAGKTTLGRKLQSSLAGSWLLLGIDLFIWTLPAEMISDPDGLVLREGVITRGRCYLSRWPGFQVAVAALARSGVDVLLDDVMLDGAVDQRRWGEALDDVEVCWVGVRCAPEIAAEREAERGDRPTGLARHQAMSVHEGVRYDLEVDTGVLGVAQSVNVIAAALRRRWSIAIAPASEEAPALPTRSAWTGHGDGRSAPWEGRRSER